MIYVVIHSRLALVDWLEDSTRVAIVRRALQNGKIEVLGGFSHVPPSNRPGWVIRLITSHNKRLYVAVVVGRHILYDIQLDRVPWQYWDGVKSSNPLYTGDRPHLYTRLHRMVTAKSLGSPLSD